MCNVFRITAYPGTVTGDKNRNAILFQSFELPASGVDNMTG